jgi:hypothetical protein
MKVVIVGTSAGGAARSRESLTKRVVLSSESSSPCRQNLQPVQIGGEARRDRADVGSPSSATAAAAPAVSG